MYLFPQNILALATSVDAKQNALNCREQPFCGIQISRLDSVMVL